MTKKIFIIASSLFLFSCSNETKESSAEAQESTGNAPIALAYTPLYSSSFKIGNPEYATMIVQGSWKDWEENKLDNMTNWVADTIVAFHSDNTMVNGRDSLMARWKRGRARYTSVIDSVHAVTSLVSTDRMHNWVLVWAKEINTNSQGKTDTTELMETWRINKDGKADMLLQYDRAKRKE